MNAEKYIQIIDSFVKPFVAKHKEPYKGGLLSRQYQLSQERSHLEIKTAES